MSNLFHLNTFLDTDSDVDILSLVDSFLSKSNDYLGPCEQGEAPSSSTASSPRQSPPLLLAERHRLSAKKPKPKPAPTQSAPHRPPPILILEGSNRCTTPTCKPIEPNNTFSLPEAGYLTPPPTATFAHGHIASPVPVTDHRIDAIPSDIV
jgi:hypothetical protein